MVIDPCSMMPHLCDNTCFRYINIIANFVRDVVLSFFSLLSDFTSSFAEARDLWDEYIRSWCRYTHSWNGCLFRSNKRIYMEYLDLIASTLKIAIYTPLSYVGRDKPDKNDRFLLLVLVYIFIFNLDYGISQLYALSGVSLAILTA